MQRRTLRLLTNRDKSEQTDRGEEVDRESGVCRIVPGEDPVEGLLQGRIADPVNQLAHAHVLRQLLKENNISGY